MASEQSPSPSPPPPPPAPTTVIDLGDDLLREIFLRLPSLPSLVRAALSCRTFLNAVRSSPVFRRSFRAAHPPPLLGFFFDPDGPAIPAFAPVRRRSDPDSAAAVRGADFFFTRLPDDDDASPGWLVCDCQGGHVLLCNRRTGQFAAYNPLTGALDLIPPTPNEFFDDGHGLTSHLDCFILASEEGDGPFRLVTICHDESRVRASVFSSDSREWRILPWSEAVEPLPEDEHWLKVGTMVNGSIYWIQANEAGLLVLNTATLQFSQMDLPPFLEGKTHLVWPGMAKDGRLCIVCPVDFGIHVWFWRADEKGFERWMLDKKFQLELKSIVEATGRSLEDVELHIVDTVDGFVYFSTGETFHNVHAPSWFLSLCMETAKLDKLFEKRCDSHVRPYILAWPPSLVNNKLCPLLEGEGA
ncbi:unnamed protein product [Triticum turgidum subsp. durum]|uniref:F-box domain-containing protein n=1 Tax=Triticum turgidum subsp. durum TaxID=4567 RepID=A0A9R0YHT8_TRITD|nr:unnamed protein product [Triticum turgidum subsp. durum]